MMITGPFAMVRYSEKTIAFLPSESVTPFRFIVDILPV